MKRKNFENEKVYLNLSDAAFRYNQELHKTIAHMEDHLILPLEDMKEEIYDALKISKKTPRFFHLLKGKFVPYQIVFIIMCLCVFIGSGCIFAVKADSFEQFFSLKRLTDHTQVNYTQTNSSCDSIKKTFPQWHDYYVPAYVPSGYQLVATDCSSTGMSKTIVFVKQNATLFFIQTQTPSVLQTNADNEQIVSQELFVNQDPGIFLQKKGAESTLFWSSKDWFFTLIGSVSQKDMLEMAKSLKYIN